MTIRVAAIEVSHWHALNDAAYLLPFGGCRLTRTISLTSTLRRRTNTYTKNSSAALGNKTSEINVQISTRTNVRHYRTWAARRGWEIVTVYTDAGISGAKGRADRPGLDQMLKAATKRGFDVVMAWSIDRLGRSLIDLLGTIQHLEACGVDLYVDQQSVDTTTPAGRPMFQICGAFAEFERSMIRQRISAGLGRAKAQGKRLGRPKVPSAVER